MSVAASAADGAVGVLRIGALRVALPLAALREIVPCPPAFDAIPVAVPGLAGALSIRGRVLPVLDAHALLGHAAGGADGAGRGALVAVLRHEGREVGLVADAACGLARPAPGALAPMARADGGPLPFDASFDDPALGGIVHRLDVAALTTLPGLPTAADTGADEGARAAVAGEAARALMLVDCGAHALAVDVADIDATLPAVAPCPSALDGTLCRGRIEHRGTLVPALDPLTMLGLGRLPDGAARPLLVLRVGGGRVALIVDAVRDIVRVSGDALRPLPPGLVATPSRFAGVLTGPDGREHWVLRAGAAGEDARVAAMATLNVASGASIRTSPSSASTPAATQALVTVDVGTEIAIALDGLACVAAMPTAIAPSSTGGPAVLGLATVGGRPATLACLATLLGGRPPADRTDARVLCVDLDGDRVGFVVAALLRIERARWRGALPSLGARGAARAPTAIVEVADGDDRRTLALADLRALAAGLRAACADHADRLGAPAS